MIGIKTKKKNFVIFCSNFSMQLCTYICFKAFSLLFLIKYISPFAFNCTLSFDPSLEILLFSNFIHILSFFKLNTYINFFLFPSVNDCRIQKIFFKDNFPRCVQDKTLFRFWLHKKIRFSNALSFAFLFFLYFDR